MWPAIETLGVPVPRGASTDMGGPFFKISKLRLKIFAKSVFSGKVPLEKSANFGFSSGRSHWKSRQISVFLSGRSHWKSRQISVFPSGRSHWKSRQISVFSVGGSHWEIGKFRFFHYGGREGGGGVDGNFSKIGLQSSGLLGDFFRVRTRNVEETRAKRMVKKS